MSIKSAAIVTVLLCGPVSPALAQDRPAAAAEFQSGWVGFVDEGPIDHALFGGAARSPFVVAGGGLQHFSVRYGSISYATTEGAFTGGGGVRVWLTDRVYASVEARLGWEPHLRISGGVGVALK